MNETGRPVAESIKVFLTHPIVKRIAASLVGAAAGFAYYYYIGCASGTCPITGNPYISTAYGAAVGFLLFPTHKAKTKQDDNEPAAGV
jgi:hypothetical protein